MSNGKLSDTVENWCGLTTENPGEKIAKNYYPKRNEAQFVLQINCVNFLRNRKTACDLKYPRTENENVIISSKCV